jgi:hypothetical protein
MPEPRRARAEAALDDVSDHLGVVLQRADELLVQWSSFGAAVRGQVEREAAAIGASEDGAGDPAVTRATASGIDRAITDQVGARLTALTAEISRLEARTRAAARAVADERTGDRRLLWVVVGGILLANALLVAILLRRPAAAPVSAPAEPARVEPAASPGAEPAIAPAATAPAATAGPADESQADAPSSSELPAPAEENAPRPESRSPVPTRPAVAPAAGEQVEVLGASAPGVRAVPAAKLPPRAPPQKR